MTTDTLLIRVRQACELLVGTTKGPWQIALMDCGDYDSEHIVGSDGTTVTGQLHGVCTDENRRLMAAAPGLADLVADLWAEVERLTAQRDAYKRAKAENDERFMIEHDDACQERDATLAEVARLSAAAESPLVAKVITGTVLGASMSSDSEDPAYNGLGYIEVYAPREQIAGIVVGYGSKATVTVYEWSDGAARAGLLGAMAAREATRG